MLDTSVACLPRIFRLGETPLRWPPGCCWHSLRSVSLPGFEYFNVDFLRQRVTETADFGTSWQITPVWKLPFEIAGTHWSFEGFADFIGKKGEHAARQALAQPQLRFDVGDLWGHSNHLFLGIEYQYWHNKYGIKGLHDSVPQALLVWRF